MTSQSDWRLGLSAGVRFLNVQNIQRNLQGQSSPSNAQKTAFARETEAYNSSTSREEYHTLCNVVIDSRPLHVPIEGFQSTRPHTNIGAYTDCCHIATGLVSEVYRSQALALKIITETRNVEPHSPSREVKILHELDHSFIIKLIEKSKDQHGRLMLVFPYMPLTLANIIDSQKLTPENTFKYFSNLLSALDYIHSRGIIHRDVKPSNILLASASGPAYLADFGTAWHPKLSASDEPEDQKVLEVGTSCYRAPEALFGHKSYGTSLDIWATGTMLAECIRKPPRPLFESRDSTEDGNQLGLILSIFKTLGTPTKETWPEAVHFPTPPFEWYQDFPGHPWEKLLEDVRPRLRDLVSKMVCYESGDRLTASTAEKLLAETF